MHSEFDGGNRANNNDGTATIKWNVVEGAGGYEVSFYNVDNPEEKVPVGEENEFVDGCSVNTILVMILSIWPASELWEILS